MKEAVKEKDKAVDVKKEIEKLVDKAQGALDNFMGFDQAKIDNIVKEMAMAGLDEHMRLAGWPIDETDRGIYEDKTIKNMFATEYVYGIKYDKTVG